MILLSYRLDNIDKVSYVSIPLLLWLESKFVNNVIFKTKTYVIYTMVVVVTCMTCTSVHAICYLIKSWKKIKTIPIPCSVQRSFIYSMQIISLSNLHLNKDKYFLYYKLIVSTFYVWVCEVFFSYVLFIKERNSYI